MRLCWHSMVSELAPAKLAASGCAPPMPPRPDVRIQRPGQVAAEVLAAGLDEGLVGALHDALAADVDPRAGRHLAVHHQALAVELVEVLPRGPLGHQVGVGQQHARRVGVGAEHAHRLARLDQQRLVGLQRAQRRQDRVEAVPVARRLADAAVDDQRVRVLGHLGVEVVLDHAVRRLDQPVAARDLGAARRAHRARQRRRGGGDVGQVVHGVLRQGGRARCLATDTRNRVCGPRKRGVRALSDRRRFTGRRGPRYGSYSTCLDNLVQVGSPHAIVHPFTPSHAARPPRRARAARLAGDALRRCGRRAHQRCVAARSAPQPPYARVKQYLKDALEAGRWAPGAQMPSEADLVGAVRRQPHDGAPRAARAAGRRPDHAAAGRGHLRGAAQPRVVHAHDQRHPGRDPASRGHRHDASVHLKRAEAAPAALAQRLGLNPGDTVFHTLIVHHEHGVALQCEDRYVNPACAPDYLDVDFTQITPTHYLLDVAPLWEAHVAIEAALPTAQEARLLGIAAHRPVPDRGARHRQPRRARHAGAAGASGLALHAREPVPAVILRRRRRRHAGAVEERRRRHPRAAAPARRRRGDDWTLRISVADIDADGPFSPFPGITRWFAVLDGRRRRACAWPDRARRRARRRRAAALRRRRRARLHAARRPHARPQRDGAQRAAPTRSSPRASFLDEAEPGHQPRLRLLRAAAGGAARRRRRAGRDARAVAGLVRVAVRRVARLVDRRRADARRRAGTRSARLLDPPAARPRDDRPPRILHPRPARTGRRRRAPARAPRVASRARGHAGGRERLGPDRARRRSSPRTRASPGSAPRPTCPRWARPSSRSTTSTARC